MSSLPFGRRIIMKELFESTVINGMTLSNRFVRSATWEGLASLEGYGTEDIAKLWVGLAQGKVGLIITGHAYVSPEGIAAPRQLGLYTDRHMRSLTEMVHKVHDAGGRIAVQISHGGRYALKLPNVLRLGPSTIESKGEIQCKEMTQVDIRKVVTQFAEAAGRAETAGSDAVQIHAGHGYLLSEFLSPFFNKRNDAYGGTVENRARLLLEVVQSVRQRVGERFPVLVKLNSQDYLEGGFTVKDMLKVASLLQQSNVDAIEMSGGNHVTGIFGDFFPARKGQPKGDEGPYYLDEASYFKKLVQIPLMLVGGIRTVEWAKKLVSEGFADYISLCRPLIREPGLIKRWGSGDTAKSTCISDNGCFNPALKGEGIRCTVQGA
jgi:2,4-dienoyl-CoA reductase-like NADH-dependent reductase (Old Yellow Enzyme family)